MNSIKILTLVAVLIAFILTPFMKKLAFYVKAVDIPKDKRKIHKKPIPLLGGVSIYLSFLITLLLKEGSMQKPEIGLLLGATVIVIGGLIDDLKDIKPWVKLSFQLVAAIILVVYDINIIRITNPLPTSKAFLDLGYLSIPITIFWVVGITNALNLIDGLDGLAAGVSFICSATIFIIAALNGRHEAALLTAILSGAIFGFLPYNFNPASIFMGDTGSQLLGFLLAAISLEGTIKSATAFAIAVPILAFGLPIYDTMFAMIRRKVNGKPIMQADRGHLHHRLLDMGLTQKQVVIIMYLISAVLGGISIIAMQISTTRSYFLLTIVIIIITFAAWKYGFFKKRD
ncbi:MraY family glycosyltransferase [Clostridium botulinum]|uniref:Glycosyl transferase n=1 Tax=Clostridium botulinum TaxID=1491 RepID=A0A9Q1ZCH2_CLOBO|nr:MraY family glycosyltransferase [Clostridium botulinum]AEB76938.1 undecaprenyl-phosphate N-acetylglucosaminyl 1-phosphate transferase [Clostridium botulinum BKT015925]KEH98372.1 glycosyl transferase [Clostridium botulinum D str. 16868]KEI05113.1 glycosyl transferase [Clostridium botulinum C/D str. Sp77]KLU75386.1 glycosyl transferase [Clostridium botulinum V891]KOA76242.1 glycosyl transferase [Clostridium botulinum]